jgi:hypothetical protein
MQCISFIRELRSSADSLRQFPSIHPLFIWIHLYILVENVKDGDNICRLYRYSVNY